MLALVDRHIPQAIFSPQRENGQSITFVEVNMKKIPLTQNKFALVDDEDYDFLMQWKWHCTGKGYAARNLNSGSRHGRKTMLMHRAILKCGSSHVDHRDLDRLNNQKRNLRPATFAQNRANSTAMKNSISGIKGVHWHSRIKKWMARIGGGETRKHLGYFKDKKDAAIAYNNAAVKKYGEFARLNDV